MLFYITFVTIQIKRIHLCSICESAEEYVMSEWILWQERGPSVEEIQKSNVFICTDGMGTFVRRYSYRMRGFVHDFNGREVMDRGIIAWMPLPEPYKEGLAE